MQPDANLLPIPTKNPANSITSILASILIFGNVPNSCHSKADMARPTTNANLQPILLDLRLNNSPSIPDTPATRPLKSNSKAAAKPIRRPPSLADYGVN